MNKLLKDGRLVLVVFIICIAIFEAFFHQHGSINKRISDKLQEYNSNFQGLLHTQFIDERILSFYQVNEQEFAFGVLNDSALGLKVTEGRSNAPLVSDGGLTWVASRAQAAEISLIYGAVLNPEISQVIVISEESKPATIIENKGVRLWFLILDSQYNTPVTIRATDQAGVTLYEYGDHDYWGLN